MLRTIFVSSQHLQIMKLQIFNSYELMSDAAADLIIDIVTNKPDAVLCFATGNTPLLTYQLLVEKAVSQHTDFIKCFCIGLDEWLGVAEDNSGSCHYILQKQIFQPLGITKNQVHLFNGTADDPENECEKMNKIIEVRGGIDCMLVGIGTNGHIGFNEPGVDVSRKAHIAALYETTIVSGQDYFNEPTIIGKGITLGMAQVMQARTLLLLASGKNKAAILQQAIRGAISNEVPASYIQQHENALILVDKEAAATL